MPGELLLVNPRKHRRHKKRSSTRARSRIYARSNPRHSRRRSSGRRIRARRNPIFGGGFSPKSFFKDTLMPSATGAAGAVALDYAVSALGFDQYSGPFIGPAIRLAGAVGIGMAGSALAGKNFGENVMAGALTVTMADMIRSYIGDAGYNYSGDQLGYINPSQSLGNYVNMGSYIGTTDEDDEGYLDGFPDSDGEYVYE
jgi:hypothetical protein